MSGASRGTGWRGIALASSGNFLEMYDFMVFGFYAAPLSRRMFPGGSGFFSLMLALSTFGAGFLMRPVGAIVLGAVLDRHGRRKGLLLTLSLMAFGTLTIAVMPPYARIGLAAPILILAGRLVQGLSAGVEVGGVSVYLSEIAPPGRRGFYVAWQSASQQVAVIFAAALGIALSLLLSPSAMLDWGWRIPFVIGCLLIPFLFLARRNMVETPAFMARESRPGFRQILRSLWTAWPLVALGTMLTTMTTVPFYVITVYTPTFGTNVLHLAPAVSLTVAMCIGISNFILLPLMGALSDRIGRLPLLKGAALAGLLTSYPALIWLVDSPSFGRLLAVGLWLSAVYAAYNGALIVFLTEMMPATASTSGFSLAYSIATAIFGGFTPAVCTFLIHQTGNRAMPGLWLSGAALVAFLSATMAGRVAGLRR
ncbi:MAG TPA: tricarballylate/proton symporter TcuC [Bryobacteraceae bacterium]|jgi:MFS family permease